MTRKKLTDAIRAAVESEGFLFHTGFEYRIAPGLTKLPAAWLHTPALEKKEGRMEGYAIYSVEIDLIESCPKTAADKETNWEALENKASEICRRLRENPEIQEITQIEYAPAEFSVTAKGEISVRLSCKARVPFCNFCDNTTI